MARQKPGMVSATVYVPEGIYRGFKKLAVDRDIPVGDLLNSVVLEWWDNFPGKANYELPPEEKPPASKKKSKAA